jgi:hypothetical protein
MNSVQKALNSNCKKMKQNPSAINRKRKDVSLFISIKNYDDIFQHIEKAFNKSLKKY